jgi:hypothetical protein
MAVLAAGVATDPALQQAIKNLEEAEFQHEGRTSRIARGSIAAIAGFKTNRRMTERVSMKRGRRSVLSMFRKSIEFIESGDIVDPPFQFAILACTATPFKGASELRRNAGLTAAQNMDYASLATPTFHIIGIEDPFKAQSEDMAALFANRKVIYIPGGHGTLAL